MHGKQQDKYSFEIVTMKQFELFYFSKVVLIIFIFQDSKNKVNFSNLLPVLTIQYNTIQYNTIQYNTI